jgi:hypothetical protein
LTGKWLLASQKILFAASQQPNLQLAEKAQEVLAPLPRYFCGEGL